MNSRRLRLLQRLLTRRGGKAGAQPLKPAVEPFVLARKPIVGTVANNVITYGTGALNIDESRIEST
ncbi:hypothetical protein B1B_10358, partial [mine drainage metagenome]